MFAPLFANLNPVLFEGDLRVGGRSSKAQIEFAVKHPIILPTSHHVMRNIIEEHHKAVGYLVQKIALFHTFSFGLRSSFPLFSGTLKHFQGMK